MKPAARAQEIEAEEWEAIGAYQHTEDN